MQQGTALISPQHSHITRVKAWGFDEKVNYKAVLYDCLVCGLETEVPFVSEEFAAVDHTKCGPECFRCKAKGLQLNAGDAKQSVVESGTTQKKWDSELNFYRQARADGIQPEGTTRASIEKAYAASEVLNKPYDGGTMPKAGQINKQVAEVMKEIGTV